MFLSLKRTTKIGGEVFLRENQITISKEGRSMDYFHY
jgi:hypothetical protein